MTELYAALLGALFGFAGALVSMLIQSRRDDKRARRTELTQISTRFLIMGAEIARMNLDIYDDRQGRLRRKAMESDFERAESTMNIHERNALRNEMLSILASFRLGYPKLAGAAQEYFDSVDNKNRENFTVVFTEILPQAQAAFEDSTRKVLA
ncbi:hypothetical protein ACFWIX_05715 [Pseudarthrobacter sp. NPDC058362]|uniref:hypothetical protein n=1 Tax=Pseudarthrobacter sp. NPDC058362 TaxID=3346458 RepID=UPI0036556E3E